MGIQVEVNAVSGDVEKVAIEFLMRILLGMEVDPVADWPIIRWVILMSPDYRREEQANNPLQINAERVALAIVAYQEGAEPGVRTYLAGWVHE